MPVKTPVTVILGSQWGDEGKGKIVDLLAKNYQAVCRCQGGSNAGHTVVSENHKYSFHLLPSGILQKNCNGVVIHLPTLFEEFKQLEMVKGNDWLNDRFIISDRAHLVFDIHQEVDALLEKYKGNKSLGTTKKGIGPAYSSKATRNGIRISDLIGDFALFEEKFVNLVKFYTQLFPEITIDIDYEIARYRAFAVDIKPFVTDTIVLIHKLIRDPEKQIMIEGANACMLDIDFGTYPFVTSSNCSIGGVITGLGIPPKYIGQTIGVTKAYTTRVGAGPFPTELLDEIGQRLRDKGNEYGSTTGRPRRCGWLDLMVVNYTHMVNGYDSIVLTKLDILDGFKEIKIGYAYKIDGQQLQSFPADLETLGKVEVEYLTVPGWSESIADCRKFDQLPSQAQAYVKLIEDLLRIPVKWIGVGQDRASIIERDAA